MDRTAVADLFDRGTRRRTRVGVEHEMTTRLEGGGPATVEQVRAAVAGTAYSPYVGFEPGGQVELSLPPAPDGARAGEALVAAVTAVRAACRRTGVRLGDEPTDPRPLADLPLQLATARYLSMQRHFDSIGPAGRRMMRATASTQLCLDWWPGRAGLEQWRVLHLAGPFLAAAYARSVGRGSRLATWLEVDPARTAFDDRLLRGDPEQAYADFAAAATVFVEGGAVAHLSTLFPPVRPRGRYLEVRFLDAQPAPAVGPLATALSGLLYDEARRSRALARLEPHGAALAATWRAAAHGDQEVAAVGREVLGIAPDLVGAA